MLSLLLDYELGRLMGEAKTQTLRSFQDKVHWSYNPDQCVRRGPPEALVQPLPPTHEENEA